MKPIILIFLLTSSIPFSNCKSVQSPDKSSDDQILAMLKSFYTSYITEVAESGNDKTLETVKSKYCSDNLLRKIKTQIENEELDYDPFINAQDSDKAWLKTLSITKDPHKLNIFVVSYTDNYTGKPVTVKLSVIKFKGLYKIDAII